MIECQQVRNDRLCLWQARRVCCKASVCSIVFTEISSSSTSRVTYRYETLRSLAASLFPASSQYDFLLIALYVDEGKSSSSGFR